MLKVCLNIRNISIIGHVDIILQVARVLGNLMAEKHLESVTDDYLTLVIHPTTCSHVLKVTKE